MNPRVSLAGLIWIAAFSLGCTKGAAEKAKEQRVQDLAALPQAVGGAAAQLSLEASSRTNDSETVRIEAVIERSKVSASAPQQVMGRPTLAQYCATATSGDGFSLTVCEYPSADQATRGAAEAKLLRGAMSGWQVKTRKKSVLELVVRSDAKHESVQAVIGAFESL